MGQRQYDLIVIGGGISGLSLAHYASKAGMRTVVLEKADYAGGCLRTMRHEGYWLELGAHTCYNSYAGLIGIIEDCGLAQQLQAREKVPFKMYIDGKVKSIPSELNFVELVCSAPRLFTMDKSHMTVGSYYSGIVGKNNYRKVVGPALSAVPSQKADDFPAEMLFKKRKRRKDIIKKFTLRGGLQTVAEAVASEKGLEVRTGVEVTSVRFDKTFFTVSASGSTFGALDLTADRIGFAVPPPACAGLLKDILPAAASKLGEIRTAHVESVGVMVKKGLVGLPEFAGLIPANDLFFSIVSRDIVADPEYRGFTFHFKPGTGNELRMKRIAEVLGTDRFEAVSGNKAVLPSPAMGHDKITAGIDSLIRDKRIFITGNYFAGLAVEDCICRSVAEFSRMKAAL